STVLGDSWQTGARRPQPRGGPEREPRRQSIVDRGPPPAGREITLGLVAPERPTVGPADEAPESPTGEHAQHVDDDDNQRDRRGYAGLREGDGHGGEVLQREQQDRARH